MSSRKVYPAYVPSFPSTGVELSCWAYITSPRLSSSQRKQYNDLVSNHSDINNNNDNNNENDNTIQTHERFYPNLITAQGSTVRIYHYTPPLLLSQTNNKDNDSSSSSNHDPIKIQDSLHLLQTFSVSGIVCSLDTLPSARSRSLHYIYDGLLIGFAGNPRLAIVYPELHHDYHLANPLSNISNINTNTNTNINNMDTANNQYQNHVHMERLQASSIIDLTPALFDRCKGAMTPLEQDLYVSICHDHWSKKEQPQPTSDDADYDNNNTNNNNTNTNTNTNNNEGMLQEEEANEGTPSIAAIVLGGGVCVATFSFLKGPIPNEDTNDDEDDEPLEPDTIVDTDENLEEEDNNMDVDPEPILKQQNDETPSQKQPDEIDSSSQDWWLYASEPYLIDLHALSRSVSSFRKSGSKYGSNTTALANKSSSQKDNPLETTNETTSFSSTWGEVLSISFLTKYSSPTLAILHTSTSSTSSSTTPSSIGYNNGNQSSNNAKVTSTASNGIWAGRMTSTSAFRHSCVVTALAVSVEQTRSVVIWSTPEGTCPCDARFIKSIPKRGGCCVVSPNGLLCIPHGGTVGSFIGNRLKKETPLDTDTNTNTNTNTKDTKKEDIVSRGTSILACNGFAHATIAAMKYPNPKPLPMLNIHLDGCRLEFLSENVAILINRDGRVYSVEIHSKSSYAHQEYSHRGRNETPTVPTDEDDLLLSCAPLPYRMEEGSCSTLSILPLYRWTGIYDKDPHDQPPYMFPMKQSKAKDVLTADFQGIGLCFCGSRFGDSVLLAYHYEHIQFDTPDKTTSLPMKRKLDNDDEEQEGRNGMEVKDERDGLDERNPVRIKRDHESNESLPPVTVSSSMEVTSDPKSSPAIENQSDKDEMGENEDMDEEARLRQEEMELYEGYTTAASPYTSSDSDDDSCSYDINALLAEAYENTKYMPTGSDDGATMKSSFHRPSIHALTVFSTLTSIHTLAAPGPLGPSCRGPSYYPGEETLVMPCGYGPSGGILMMHSIADGRNIKNEIDIRGVTNGWMFPKLGLILFGMNGNVDGKKAMLMRLNQAVTDTNETDDPNLVNPSERIMMKEVNIDEWGKEERTMQTDQIDTPQKLFQNTIILAAKEWHISSVPYLILVTDATCHMDQHKKFTVCIMLQAQEDTNGSELQVVESLEFGKDKRDLDIISITTLEHFDGKIYFGCVWSDGQGSLLCIVKAEDIMDDVSSLWQIIEAPVPGYDVAIDKITAMDIITISGQEVFPSTVSHSEKADETMSNDNANHSNPIEPKQTTEEENAACDEDKFDAEDIELYGLLSNNGPSLTSKLFRESDQSYNLASTKQFLYIAITTSSNKLQVFDSSLDSTLWQASGSGYGFQKMSPVFGCFPTPETSVQVIELRFFYCGENKLVEGNALCCAMLTDKYDLHVYRVSPSRFMKEEPTTLFRVSLGTSLSRTSVEESRYRSKLVRKGMLPSINSQKAKEAFRNNKLHRFNKISGHRGLFASLWRPLWIVKCDSRIIALNHKLRHVAPYGRNDVPISVFLEMGDDQNSETADKDHNRKFFCDEGFITVHERIGRIGSQRLTIYDGIFQLPSQKNNVIYPDASGMLLTKIPFGATVRQIAFFDDPIYSTTTKPLFLLLVSKVLDLDQSFLNDDGLTPEERQHVKEEREREKTRRQVEADLGGFDVEQEWVEEIEREDVFEVDTDLGGAPKIQVEKHEVWLVCGGEEWSVLDEYELKDYEHGMTLKVMNLTDIEEDGPTNTSTPSSSGDNDEVFESPLFVTVGTGIVDKDGEDIGSKGRILLFEVKRRINSQDDDMNKLYLSLIYTKDILLGPVTSLGCLSCEGKSRVVVGAGAEVTVEQWGDGKLTQVGFFHANMQVQDIVLFKTFFLLSDAYDSLHFLVWRESDKSLTLLAKDYEPTAVYAAGTISRGGSLAFICHDDRQNLQFFQYAPKDEASRGGNKLVGRADFHIGMQTIALQSHWCKSSLLVSSSTPNSTFTAMKQQDPLFGHGDDYQRFAVHFGTTDGAISTVVPVSERNYWRLTALQSVMSNALESNCALSHRAWRLYRRSARRGGGRNNDRKKGVLDGSLLFQFINLGIFEQEQLASAIGSTIDVILDNLLELDCASRMK